MLLVPTKDSLGREKETSHAAHIEDEGRLGAEELPRGAGSSDFSSTGARQPLLLSIAASLVTLRVLLYCSTKRKSETWYSMVSQKAFLSIDCGFKNYQPMSLPLEHMGYL